MAKSRKNASDLTAANLLHSLRCCGGSVPLYNIKFSREVIQALVDRELVEVTNTGCQ
ncbi:MULTISPECIES: hypothetical protein [Nostocales]|uniref:hypothetical protein n=1 Tax=Nostocales TaxID=1161 RepID=UPI001686B8F7|nr:MULTISPECIES: hypothetical protein [Nostocales]MBD2302586.1 hypothetical protein [Nostoc sp. FACHB-190]MBD2492215.1 hypothetical protein [Aulosira sp. FACHB-615]